MHRILIADSESRIASFIQRGLNAHCFLTENTASGREAIAQTLGAQFDLLILDLNLPDIDGLRVIQALRGQGDFLPIIILSTRNDIHDKVAAFDGGADDYMTKPFHFEELLARVKTHLRRSPKPAVHHEKTVCVADVELNLSNRRMRFGNRVIDLPTREFMLAETFFRHPGQVLSRAQLLDRVWGYDHDPGSNIVDVYVGYLRKKLGKERIETVRGMGYRLQILSKEM